MTRVKKGTLVSTRQDTLTWSPFKTQAPLLEVGESGKTDPSGSIMLDVPIPSSIVAKLTCLKAALTSVPALTLYLLVAIDILLRQGNALDAMGYHTVDLWNLPPKVAVARRTCPDLALIGSSLLLTLNLKEKESFTFTRLFPPYFQKRLREATHENVTTINMCTGSQVPSESYLITRALLSQPDHPRVIIYGIALRDMVSDKYANEVSCESFAGIAPFVPVDLETMSLMSNDGARLEFALSHFWYLYRNRTDFQYFLAAQAKDWLENLPLDVSFSRIRSDYENVPSRTGYLWERWVPRQRFEGQYRRRPDLMKMQFWQMHAEVYRQASMVTRALQARYLEGLASLCRRKGVDLVIVNMPLSAEIMALAPPGLTEAYQEFLRGLSESYGVTLIDLYGDSEFPSGLFSDGVHLTCPGSKLLADRLIDELQTKHPEVLRDLGEHALSRAQAGNLKEEREAPYNRDTILY